MKFMHLSDVRLGFHGESGRPWEKERQTEVAGTLKRAAEQAEEEQADLVLIAGGLFAHRPVTAELEEADRVFAAHPAVNFVIIAGENDPVRKNSPVMSFRFSGNVHYVLSGKTEKILFPELGTAVYARSCTEEEQEPAEDLTAGDGGDAAADDGMPVRIALLCVSSAEQASRIGCVGFSYVALGGVNSYTELIPKRVCCSGGLEAEGMTDTGVHGYCRGEISGVTGAVTSLEFVPLSSASYVPLLVKINTGVTPEAFAGMIGQEIEKRGASNIYRIRITGQKKPEYRFDLSALSGKYRIAGLIDEAEPRYDFEALYEEHRQDMIGCFISTLRKRRTELPEIDRKAMFQGIDALLKTADGEAGTR